MERIVLQGQTWKHYRTGLYLVTDVIEDYQSHHKHGDVMASCDELEFIATSDLKKGDTVVQYEKLDESKAVFFRELTNFLAELPDGSNRFELIEVV